ncbi:glycosyltransferase [Chryseobacterium sp. S-02]|uniref:glycosyltransferase n=1 Tax=Chryseobacterium sp. S-02 TaxID=3404064 RepID=UPI003CF3C757
MHTKIKIVHITQGFGGLFTYIKQIVQKIDRTRFELEIVAPENSDCRQLCEEYSIKYTIIDLKRGLNPYKDFSGLLNLYRFLKKNKPDLVHLHSAKAGFLGRIAARFSGVKSIYTPHGISYLSFTGFKRIIFFLLEVLAKKYTDDVLACSESERIRCLYEVGISDKKITVIPNAVKVKDNLENYKVIAEEKLHIGVIARLTYQKNPLLFVEIANKIKQIFPFVEFSILGAGLHDHLKEEVWQLIERYNLKNQFKIFEWGSFGSAEEYLKTLDIFLMPSVFEGLPFSLLEAMNENVLCITSKCDGCCDVINNNENGFSCMDLENYVEAVKKAVNFKEQSQHLRVQAKKDLLDKYNLDDFIVKLEDYYLLAKK